MEGVWKEISKYSRKLHDKGYMVSHSGNLSVRVGDKVYIKRRSAAADEIGSNDVVELPLRGKSEAIRQASVEAEVHRAIYNLTSAQAVVHAHPPYSVVCSLLYDEVEPLNIETQYYLGVVPVVKGVKTARSDSLNDLIARKVAAHKGVIVKGHGTFAMGKDLEEAYQLTCMIESASMIRYLVDLARAWTSSKAAGTVL